MARNRPIIPKVLLNIAAGVSVLIFCSLPVLASRYWSRVYGSDVGDESGMVVQTPDQGFIAAGRTNYFYDYMGDCWILKLDPRGDLEWQKVYETAGLDDCSCVEPTPDGGYIAAGMTQAFGRWQPWVFKLDASGAIEWQKQYGWPLDGFPTIRQTSDGGYLMAGWKSTSSYQSDIFIVKLNSSGSIAWQKAYGGSVYEMASHDCFDLTPDNGLVVAGRTESFGAGGVDAWVFKLDSSGGIEWQKTYGGPGYDCMDSVRLTQDGGFIVAGSTDSFGDNGDAWVLKLDASGAIEWQKAYGGSDMDSADLIR